MFQHGRSQYHFLSEWFRMQIALKKVNLICFWETTTKSMFREGLMPPASQEWRAGKAFLLGGSGLCWEDVSRCFPSWKQHPLVPAKGRLFLKFSQELSTPQLYSQTLGLPVNYKATTGCNLSPQTPAWGLLLFPMYNALCSAEVCTWLGVERLGSGNGMWTHR